MVKEAIESEAVWHWNDAGKPNERIIGPSIWEDTRSFPLYTSCASLLILVGQILYFASQKKERSWLKHGKRNLLSQVTEYTRCLGAVAVIGLTIANGKVGERVYILVLWAMAYACILLLGSLVSVSQLLLSTHAASVHLVALGVFAYRDIVPLATGSTPRESGALVYTLIGVLAFTGMLAPLFVPRELKTDAQSNEKPNPSRTASLFSFLLYFYLDPLIQLANKKSELVAEDLPQPLASEKAGYLKDLGFPILDPRSSISSKNLIIGWFRVFKKEYAAQVVLMLIMVVNGFAGPIATLRILSYFETNDHDGVIRPWVWIIWLVLGPVLRSIAWQLSLKIKTHANIRTELIFNQLVFEHAIRVRLNTASPELPDKDKKKKKNGDIGTKLTDRTASPVGSTAESSNSANAKVNGNSDAASLTAVASSSSSITGAVKDDGKKADSSPEKEGSSQAGGISNLLTVDLNNLTHATDIFGLNAIINLIVTFVLLYNILGWSSFVGVAVLVVTMPIPGYMVKLRASLQKQQMKKADARVTSVTQAVNVLRMVKLFGWEKQMESKITEKREVELKYIWKTEALDMGSAYTVLTFPLAAMIGTYSCYTLVMHLPLNASLIFSSIALFDMVRTQSMQFAYWLPVYIKGKVSADRFAAFLSSGEDLSNPTFQDAESSAVTIRDTCFNWKSATQLQSDTSKSQGGRRPFSLRIHGELSFLTGKVNLIAGPTGCGKTSLLMSLLGEMVYEPLSEDSRYYLPRSRGVAYAAQEAWVLNATIKENVLFGSELQEDRYKKVLHQTALDKDLEMFDAGDLTEVGEKGITLSGGQKARITLARAIYSRAQILLLDDVLSALDVHTAKWVVDECLGGDLIRGRTVLLVTHNILLAKTVADFLVTLKLDGTVDSHGAVDEVLRDDAELRAQQAKELEVLTKKEMVNETPTDKAAQATKGKLIVAEEIAIGRVGWPAFSIYLTSLGGPFFYISVLLSQLALALFPVLQKAFLGYWSSRYEVMPLEEVPVKLYLVVYATLGLTGSLLGFFSFVIFLVGVIRASRSIHQRLIHSIMTSTLRWLDTTPVSRVLTRCSQDMDVIDNQFGYQAHSVSGMGMSIIISATTVVVVGGWVMLLPAFVIVTMGLAIARYYMHAQMPVKRLMSNAKSPIVSQVHTAISGLVSVRAYGAQQKFRSDLGLRLDAYSRIGYPYWDLNRWIAIRIDLLGATFTGSVATWLIYGLSASSSTIGFTLTLLANFNMLLLIFIRLYNEVEIAANSLERVRDYLQMDHEPESTKDGTPPAYWPASGNLTVENLSARYSKDSPEVLRGVSFVAKSGERIGVVGRTGAGKSTLGLALLRAIPTEGRVLFDGRDTAFTNLDSLRTNISIIPQSPELLAGTLRENLDPLGGQEDATLNDALNSAGLSHLRSEDGKDQGSIGLDSTVESGGSNFSQGQRQIIALARAFVRKSKVLIMDEATAAIDYKTDHLIQEFIRSEFKDVTVITVAHRLQTIMDSDKILVLDAGRAVEWGEPKSLLQKSSGYFKSLVDESSDKAELHAAVGL